MRIAVVVRGLEIGGMQRVAVSLADAFEKEGHETHLIYFKHKGNVLFPDEAVRLHSFQLKRLQVLTGVGILWKMIAQLLNAVVKRSFFVWNGLFSVLLFWYQFRALEKEHGKFDLVVFRGQGTFEMMWPMHDDRFVFVNENILCGKRCSASERFYSRLLFNRRNVSCVSKGVEKTFLDLQESAGFKAKKVTTITNLIDIVETQKKADAYLPETTEPYILSVGRLVPQKNVALLVNAYAYAREHLGLTLRLVIVGDGNQRQDIEKRITGFGLDEYVTMTGNLSNPFPWMKHAELFVLSSKFEGLGMVLLEAMACGTDVVATNSPGGVKDVMTGRLATHLCEQETVALAEKMMQVLSEEEHDFKPYLEAYLPETITGKFIEDFVTDR